MKKEYNYKLLSLILVVIAIITAITYILITDDNVLDNNLIIDYGIAVDDSLLNIFYFDVGQGDSTLIMKNGITMLIDGGNDWDGERLSNYLRILGIEKIDYLIATHMHADHIGGLNAIVENFEIGAVYMPEADQRTIQERQFLTAIRDNNVRQEPVYIGHIFYLGNARAEIMFIDNSIPENLNLSGHLI